MQVYESFITVMLTNRQLPLDSIHTMLQMMVMSGSDHKYNKTPQQLSVFFSNCASKKRLSADPTECTNSSRGTSRIEIL